MGAIDSSIVNVAVPAPPRRARRHRRGDHLGHHRLRHRHRARHAADRVPRPPLRPEARLPRRASCCSSSARRSCGMARTLPTLVVFRVLQGFGAGALQPTEQAILRQTFPPEGAGHGDGAVRHGGHDRPRVRPDAGRLHRRQLQLAVDLLHQPAGRRARPLHGHELRARAGGHPRRQPRRRREAAQEHGLGRASRSSASGCARCSTCSRRATATTGSTRRSSRRCARRSLFALAAFVIRELTAPVPGGQPLAVQGHGVPLGDAHRRRDVRDADVDHVPPAGVHAGAARLHRDAVGPRAHAALARHDGRRCRSSGASTTTSRRASSSLSASCCFCISAYQMSHYTLDTSPSADRLDADPPGRRLQLPLRAAHHGGAVHASRATSWPTRRAQLARAPDRRLARPRGLRDAALAHACRRARTGLVAHLVAGRPEVHRRASRRRADVLAGRAGLDATTARAASQRLLEFAVDRQATVLTFEKMFLLAGILFLLVDAAALLPQSRRISRKPARRSTFTWRCERWKLTWRRVEPRRRARRPSTAAIDQREDSRSGRGGDAGDARGRRAREGRRQARLLIVAHRRRW